MATGSFAGRIPGTDALLALLSNGEQAVVEPSGRLGFGAAIENVGDGSLVLDGHRTAAEPTTRVTQVITLRTGRSTHRPVAGSGLTYERGPDHAHWHYQAAIVYRLHHADGHLARAGTKTRLCLGDRYRLSGAQPPGTPARPRFTGFCGRGEPELTSLRQGVSVGHGDDYPGFLEGQSLDLTGLPAGTYRLVHETDPDRRLAEADGSNNTAGVTFTLTWPRGPEQAPSITVIGEKAQLRRRGQMRCTSTWLPSRSRSVSTEAGARDPDHALTCVRVGGESFAR